MFKFLRSNSMQSTLRVVVFMTTVMVCINLGALPLLIALGILLGQDLSWVGIYLTGLVALSGTSILGKIIQKKYETLEGAPPSPDTQIE